MPNQMVAPCSYTALYNMLDYPAGVVKVTNVTEEDEMKLEQFPEDDAWDKQIKQECKVGHFDIVMLLQIQMSGMHWLPHFCTNSSPSLQRRALPQNSERYRTGIQLILK